MPETERGGRVGRLFRMVVFRDRPIALSVVFPVVDTSAGDNDDTDKMPVDTAVVVVVPIVVVAADDDDDDSRDISRRRDCSANCDVTEYRSLRSPKFIRFVGVAVVVVVVPAAAVQ